MCLVLPWVCWFLVKQMIKLIVFKNIDLLSKLPISCWSHTAAAHKVIRWFCCGYSNTTLLQLTLVPPTYPDINFYLSHLLPSLHQCKYSSIADAVLSLYSRPRFRVPFKYHKFLLFFFCCPVFISRFGTKPSNNAHEISGLVLEDIYKLPMCNCLILCIWRHGCWYVYQRTSHQAVRTISFKTIYQSCRMCVLTAIEKELL